MVEVLGSLRGGAMKIGQLASFVDVEFLPPEYRTIYQEKLAALRDAAPAMSWTKVRGVLDSEWEEPVESLFEDFDHEATAAASIGQIHRATLPGGRRVAVKVQYPEIADALAADLDLAAIGVQLARALAPGLDPRAIVAEVRERILEELDYELEAQQQRFFARAYRGHPFIHVPEVMTALSRRRVMVSDWVDGQSFDQILRLDQPARDRVGEIIDRFAFGSMHRLGRFNTDAHPGNYLLCADGRMAFLDFGSTKTIDPSWLEDSYQLLRSVLDGDPKRFMDEVARNGYFRRADRVDAEWLLNEVLVTGEWFLADREVTIEPDYVARMLARAVEVSPRALRVAREVQTIPPDDIWFRRVQLGVFAVLGRLHATGNWHRIMREYVFDDEPSTELGKRDHEFWSRRIQHSG